MVNNSQNTNEKSEKVQQSSAYGSKKWSRSSMPDSTMRLIQNSESTSHVISEVGREGKKNGFVRLRYYILIGDQQQNVEVLDTQSFGNLVSKECFGHSDDLSTLFRSGIFHKSKQSHPLESHDSYWCFYTGRPVVFQWDHAAKAGFTTSLLGTWVCVKTPKRCAEDLGSEKSPVWVDFPLTVAGSLVGKVSCCVNVKNTAELSDGFVQHVDSFWALLQMVAPLIEYLQQKELRNKVAEIQHDLDKNRPQRNSLSIAFKDFRRHICSLVNTQVSLHIFPTLLTRNDSY